MGADVTDGGRVEELPEVVLCEDPAAGRRAGSVGRRHEGSHRGAVPGRTAAGLACPRSLKGDISPLLNRELWFTVRFSPHNPGPALLMVVRYSVPGVRLDAPNPPRMKGSYATVARCDLCNVLV
ncbi:hypothetical protein GCM10009801_37650 [Streptomyces albiaxialis]|uniref:Uncharacterized protein n=1 Tax=Streptomyces albiaxialis TaxID=329523 RepID=A0ABN2W314_9ACTN